MQEEQIETNTESNSEKEEKKGYISSVVGGIVNASTYVAGGILNVGKGVVHTTAGILGIGPGIGAGVSKVSNGVSTVVDGVVTGTIESVTGKDIDRYSDNSNDMLRRYSSSELRKMAKNNPSLFVHCVLGDFEMHDKGEDALRLLRVIAPEIKNWPKKEQTVLLNSVISTRASHAEEKEAVEILLEAGVNPNIGVKEIHHHTKNEISPFYNLLASPSYKSKAELVALFLEHGADPNLMMVDEFGKKIPIHTYAYTDRVKEVMKDYIKPESKVPDASRMLETNSTHQITNEQSGQKQGVPPHPQIDVRE
ncbi:MAG: hypothetical protein IJY92_00365 [Alphaproteobacteria bacterium]|nr:hypothetical protein [Alphaproteobacteria bacterium]